MKCMLLLLSIPRVLFCPAATGSHVLSLAVAAQKHLGGCQPPCISPWEAHMLVRGSSTSTCQAKKQFTERI